MSSAAAKKQRPKYLSLPAILFQIRLPLAGRVSILHRVSGTLLVFPFAAWLLYLLDASLRSEQGFSHIREYLGLPLAKAGMLLLIWAACHHFCAGIRYLLLDLGVGLEGHAGAFAGVEPALAERALIHMGTDLGLSFDDAPKWSGAPRPPEMPAPATVSRLRPASTSATA